MIQDLHRHDFYFILVLTKGFGVDEIDSVEHQITKNGGHQFNNHEDQSTCNKKEWWKG
ncbi:MAG TPA: hypothetical protein VE467_20790 [Chryseolinea sp.]|nr:hypothetical protein [Chryseolinea sp.]